MERRSLPVTRSAIILSGFLEKNGGSLYLFISLAVLDPLHPFAHNTFLPTLIFRKFYNSAFAEILAVINNMLRSLLLQIKG